MYSPSIISKANIVERLVINKLCSFCALICASMLSKETSKVARARIRLNGVVQGVGFRPFVKKLALKFNLGGFILNNTAGVLIEVEGEKDDILGFYDNLIKKAPACAIILTKDLEWIKVKKEKEFKINKSVSNTLPLIFVSPDLAICKDCKKELFTPEDRRFLYPFINCTNCGPRYTIIKSMPYDRISTTMQEFPMCNDCEKEYKKITDRRFHAQPNCCYICGPEYYFIDRGRKLINEEAIKAVANLIDSGEIVAIMGIGGVYLSCDAWQKEVIKRLRILKNRPYKPFALMAKNLDVVERVAFVGEEEKEVLTSSASPIVMLKKKMELPFVSPNLSTIGIMLPYAPVHLILFNYLNTDLLVMTSGNKRGEPILHTAEEAIKELSSITSLFLLHNRPIENRCDDSVVKIIDKNIQLIRRARGFAPLPVVVREKLPEILAVGGETKSSIALSKGNFVYLSPYIGELDNYATYLHFKNIIKKLTNLLEIYPKIIAYDLHPDYLSTRFAMEQKGDGVTLIPVQHHYAHFLSVKGEHKIQGQAIGVIMDGTGFGLDNNLWGGEIFVGDEFSFKRFSHLSYYPLPGGEKAIKEPWRMAVSYLSGFLTFKDIENLAFLNNHREELKVIWQMIKKGINSPLTSSAGRLFDAVSVILGITTKNTYEGQAPMELEALVNSQITSHYPVFIEEEDGQLILDPAQVLNCIVEEVKQGKDLSSIATKFHNTLVKFITDVVKRARESFATGRVLLSGGVFQNNFLTFKLKEVLEPLGFKVYLNSRVAPNDEGIPLGQIIGAYYYLLKERK